MCIRIEKDEHTEPLGIPTPEILVVNVVHMTRSMQSETSNHALYDHLLRERCGADLGRGLSRHHSWEEYQAHFIP